MNRDDTPDKSRKTEETPCGALLIAARVMKQWLEEKQIIQTRSATVSVIPKHRTLVLKKRVKDSPALFRRRTLTDCPTGCILESHASAGLNKVSLCVTCL